MPNLILPIPQFPNVPLTLGVPPVLRNVTNSLISGVNGLANGSISGTLQGVFTAATGAFTGNLSGTINSAVTGLISGQVNAITGALTGVLSGSIPGVLGSSVTGLVNGLVNGGSLTGALKGALSGITGTMTSDAPGVTDNSTAPQWGLFDEDGDPVITATSVFAFEYSKEWKIPNYPVEQGGFESYNKVELPGNPRLVFTQDGSIGDRTSFLNDVANACASLDLYAAYTPEYQFPSVNAIKYNILQRTSEQNVTLLKVEVMIEEVRVTATQQFSSSAQSSASPTATATPSSQASVSDGTVQPQTPDASQAAPNPQAGADASAAAAANPSSDPANALPAGFPTPAQTAAGGSVATLPGGSQWVVDSNGNALNGDGSVNAQLTAESNQSAQLQQQQAANAALLKKYS
jgi:hypothetical protein